MTEWEAEILNMCFIKIKSVVQILCTNVTIVKKDRITIQHQNQPFPALRLKTNKLHCCVSSHRCSRCIELYIIFFILSFSLLAIWCPITTTIENMLSNPLRLSVFLSDLFFNIRYMKIPQSCQRGGPVKQDVFTIISLEHIMKLIRLIICDATQVALFTVCLYY